MAASHEPSHDGQPDGDTGTGVPATTPHPGVHGAVCGWASVSLSAPHIHGEQDLVVWRWHAGNEAEFVKRVMAAIKPTSMMR